MKSASVCVALFLAILLFSPTFMSGRHIGRPHSHHHHRHHHHHKRSLRARESDESMTTLPKMYNEIRRPATLGKHKRKPEDTLEIAGSSLPDCSHACGSCLPCRLVMVSFVCASIEEAETCPMTYRCMCKHKSYPVP